MSLQRKLEDQSNEILDNLNSGGWWLPSASDNLQEWLQDRSEELKNEFIKPMVLLGTQENESSEYNDKKQSYLLKFIDLHTFEERFTPINGNLDRQLAMLMLGLTGTSYEDITEDQEEDIAEFKKYFNQISDFTDHDINKRSCIVTYHGKTKGFNNDDKFHTYSVKQLELDEEDIKEIEEKISLPF